MKDEFYANNVGFFYYSTYVLGGQYRKIESQGFGGAHSSLSAKAHSPALGVYT